MDEIKVLEEIGLKEVSDRTHIEIKHLKYMINMEFDKLNRVNTLGFVKIIKREFDVDFTEWLQEAERYWEANKTEDEDSNIFIVQEPKKFPKILTFIITISVLVAILYGAYMFLDKKLDFFEKEKSSDINYTYEETPVVKEAKENIDKESLKEEQNESNLSEISQEENSTTTVSNEVNETNDTQKESVKSVGLLEDNNATKKASTNKNLAVISPRAKLWIGVIYLDDGSRDSYLGENNFTVDLSRDQLITTGHGNFDLKFSKGLIKKFSKKTPMKFLVKDGNISEISVHEFKKLNKGNLW